MKGATMHDTKRRRKAAALIDSVFHRGGRFYRMAPIIPEQVGGGHVRIEHFTVGKEPQFRAMLHPNEYVTPGTYVRLMAGGEVIMSDTDHEQRTNREVVFEAKGDVLIAGLGIGLIVLPILAKPDVTSVTVIEKSREVIGLVEPHLRAWPALSAQTGQRFTAKLNVVWGDIHSWRPDQKGRQFDTVYFDIWGDQSTDEIPVMQQLHRTFRSYLRKGGWISSWNYETLRDRKRRGGW